MLPGLVRRNPGSLAPLALAAASGGSNYPPGVIGLGPSPRDTTDEPTTELLSGQALTPSGLLAAISAFTGAAITRPQRYDLFVAKYGTVIWVYRAVSVNAQNVAAVPLKVYRKPAVLPKKGEIQLIEAPESKFAVLMNKVNPVMTRFDLWELTSINLDLVGNSYWVVFRDADDEPAELWPVRPDRVEILSDPTFGIRGYRYRVPRGVFDFALRDVIHIRSQNPWHDFYGQGALSPAWGQVEAYETMVAWRKFFYDNNAQPAAVLQTPKSLSRPQLETLREMWQSMFAGPKNAGRIAILQDDLKWERAGASPRDAMVVKDLELSRQDILAAFGVPLAVVGVEQGDVGRRREQIQNYRESTIKPRLEKIEQTINEFLAPQFGLEYEAHFDTSEFIREDELQRSQIDVAEVSAGLTKINEARKRRGQEPVPWGDTWWMNGGLVSAEVAMAPPEPLPAFPGLGNPPPGAAPSGEPPAPPEKPEPGAQDTPDLDQLSPEGKAVLLGLGQGFAKMGLPVARGLLDATPSDASGMFAGPFADDATSETVWKSFVERTIPAERKFAMHVRGALQRIGRASAAAVRRAGSPKAAIKSATPSLGDILPTFVSIGRDLYPSVLELGWDEAQRRMRLARARRKSTKARKPVEGEARIDFSLEVPEIDQYLEERPRRYGTDVSQTTIRHIREQLQEGVESGETIDELADRILEFTDVDATYRAQRIARTEVISASNAGSWAHYRESGVVAQKEWLTAQDERVRDAHADAEGQMVDLDDPFVVDGEELEFPGDPNGSPENIINCRCTILPVISDSESEVDES